MFLGIDEIFNVTVYKEQYSGVVIQFTDQEGREVLSVEAEKVENFEVVE